MRKLRSLTGMSVVCGSHRIGRLLQADLTADLRQLSGIWVGRMYVIGKGLGKILTALRYFFIYSPQQVEKYIRPSLS